MTFEQLNLNQSILKAISVCGYSTPTPIQARAIPEILTGTDLVASAQTGTGKTAAFVLPALHKLSTANKRKNKAPRILILSPTRELASQITKDIQRYGKFLSLRVAHLIGGSSYHQQIKQLAQSLDIIVATPGRLLDHIRRNRIDFSNIEMFILDEADRMLDMGFIDDVETIAKQINTPKQTLLFSATIDHKLTHIIRKLLNNPLRLDLTPKITAPTKIKQSIYLAKNFSHKMSLFLQLLEQETIFKAIIFSATKINADNLANTMNVRGFKTAALHGDLKQNKRNRVMDQLRCGKLQFLVATDVAARGLDIADISHVINFDLPRACEDYIHRIGRTGRAGKDGIAISFALPQDARHLTRIERYTQQKLKREDNVEVNANVNLHADDLKCEVRERSDFKEYRNTRKKDYRNDYRNDYRKGYKSNRYASKRDDTDTDADDQKGRGHSHKKELNHKKGHSDKKVHKHAKNMKNFKDQKNSKNVSKHISKNVSKNMKNVKNMKNIKNNDNEGNNNKHHNKSRRREFAR